MRGAITSLINVIKKGIEENKNRFLFDGAQHNY
jgi:hypothetical protein